MANAKHLIESVRSGDEHICIHSQELKELLTIDALPFKEEFFQALSDHASLTRFTLSPDMPEDAIMSRRWVDFYETLKGVLGQLPTLRNIDVEFWSPGTVSALCHFMGRFRPTTTPSWTFFPSDDDTLVQRSVF